MKVSGAGRYFPMHSKYILQKAEGMAQTAGQKAASTDRDTLELSGRSADLGLWVVRSSQIGFEEIGSPAPDGGDVRQISGGVQARENLENTGGVGEEAEEEYIKAGGSVGINAAKLARMLAAAKTREQVRAVIAQIRSDLQECDAGRAQGYDVDEASVGAAEQLLQEAQRRMGQAENRESTPEEEMAAALAALM